LKRFLQSEIGAALLWVASALVMAALLTPWVFQGGKWLAAVAEVRELPALVESLAGSCGRAEIDRFYDRALLFSALVLLPILLRRIRRMRSAGEALVAQADFGWRAVLAQIAIGLVIAAGFLTLLGVLLDLAGAYTLRESAPRVGKLLSKAVIPAVAAPLVEEWLFRGLLLGLWLRFAKPAIAALGSSLVFAFLHFLKPPAGYEIAAPGDPLAGFELLGKILLHFTQPQFFVTQFATLCVVGLILAWARLRTGALWFSIGLHAGWVLAFKGFNLFYTATPSHPLRPWWIGDNLKSGVLPLLALGLTALVCQRALRPFSRASR
jgi:membrane protease YdiL (CAAX protease family)